MITTIDQGCKGLPLFAHWLRERCGDNMTKILRAFCLLMCVVCLVLSFALTTVNNVIYQSDTYEKIVDDEYVEYMQGYISNLLQDEAQYYQIEPQYFTDYISKGEIERYSKEYYKKVYALLSGDKVVEPTPFSSEQYKKGIKAFKKEIQKDGYHFADEAVDQIAEETALLSQNCCNSINQRYLQKIASITSNNKVKQLVQSHYILFALSTLFAVLVFVIKKADRLSRLCLAFSSMFIPSLAVNVLMNLFANYDFKQKLAIGDIPLKRVVDVIVDKTMDCSTFITGVVAVIFGVGFIACLILRIIRIYKK